MKSLNTIINRHANCYGHICGNSNAWKICILLMNCIDNRYNRIFDFIHRIEEHINHEIT